MVVKGMKMKKATDKELINTIKEKSKLLLADRKNSNNIVDIISSSEVRLLNPWEENTHVMKTCSRTRCM